MAVFIELADLIDGMIIVNVDQVLRIRESDLQHEPQNSVFITLENSNKPLFVSNPIGDVVAVIGEHKSLIMLTTPSGISVWLQRDRISQVRKSDPNSQSEKAKSIVLLDRSGGSELLQAVSESVDEVKALLI